MEKGTNRDAVATLFYVRGGGRAVPVAARGALAAGGAETTGRVQPGV